MILTELIKQLREQTGAAIGDVKEALESSGGDSTKALDFLRKKGQKIAGNRSARQVKEGLVASYVHANGKVGALVLVACETDFVALNQDFKNFVHELTLQIAATNPLYITPKDVPQEVIAKEKEVYSSQALAEGKPAAMIEKIVAGRLEKFYSEVCLLKQPYIKDDKLTIEDMLKELIGKIGENIQIKEFARLSL